MEEQEELLGGNGVGIRVSTFDYSVENHFKEMDMISKLCGEAQTDSVDEIEIQCYKSSITFLRLVIFSVYKLHVDGLLLFLCLCIIF
jgi:general transcription factor 3C polypeptide 2